MSTLNPACLESAHTRKGSTAAPVMRALYDVDVLAAGEIPKSGIIAPV
jgi:hypothetical protein